MSKNKFVSRFGNDFRTLLARILQKIILNFLSNFECQNFEKTGFCGISDHSLDKNLISDVLNIFNTFFSLPTETKMKYFEPIAIEVQI